MQSRPRGWTDHQNPPPWQWKHDPEWKWGTTTTKRFPSKIKNFGLSGFPDSHWIEGVSHFPAPDNGNHFQYSGHFCVDGYFYLPFTCAHHPPAIVPRGSPACWIWIAWDNAALRKIIPRWTSTRNSCSQYYIQFILILNLGENIEILLKKKAKSTAISLCFPSSSFIFMEIRFTLQIQD